MSLTTDIFGMTFDAAFKQLTEGYEDMRCVLCVSKDNHANSLVIWAHRGDECKNASSYMEVLNLMSKKTPAELKQEQIQKLKAQLAKLESEE